MKLFVGTTTSLNYSLPQMRYHVVDIDDSLNASIIYSSDVSNPHTKWGFAWDNDTLYYPNPDTGIIECDKDLNTKATYAVEEFTGTVTKPNNPDNIGTMFNRPHQRVKSRGTYTSQIQPTTKLKCSILTQKRLLQNHLKVTLGSIL